MNDRPKHKLRRGLGRRARLYSLAHIVLVGTITLAVTLHTTRAVEPLDPPAADVAPEVVRLTRTYFSKYSLQYSPDGTHIVYSRHHANRRHANLVLVGARLVREDGSDDRPLLSAFDAQVQIQEHATWSPEGTQLLLSGGGNDTGNSAKDVFICDLDGERRATDLRKVVAGEAVQLGEEPAWSPEGRRFAFVTTTEQLWLVDRDGKNRVQVLEAAGSYLHQPAWSPDGDWVAFASDRDGDIELYKVRCDGTELVRLTQEPGIDCRPRWSRDGRWIVFSSNRSGNVDIHLMRADGSEVRNLTRHPAVDDHAAWAPDGRTLAFVSMRDGGFDIYRMSLPDDVQIDESPPPRSESPAPAVGELVLHHDFEQMRGAFALDRTERFPLELHGTEVVSGGGISGSEDSGSALAFDGKTSFASAGNPEPLRIGGALTISVWVKPGRIEGNGYLVSKHGWNLYLGADLIPRFETRNAADTAWDTLTAQSAIEGDRWSFVTAVFDPHAAKLLVYINGQLSAERVRTDGAIGGVLTYPFEIGHYNASRTQNLHGLLDELRIYRVALPAERIEQEFGEQAPRVFQQAPP